MNESSKRRLALACCAAMAFAFAACDDDGGSNNKPQGNTCGDAVCTDQQECIDNVCKDKADPSDPCALCTDNQTCEDGKCVDKDPSDPCAQCTDDQTCKDGKCVDKDPADPCSKCTDSQTCEDGVCKDIVVEPCGGACEDGKICDTGTDTCVDPPEDPCAKCSEDEVCVNLVCEKKDPCANKTCPDGERCDSDKGGECVTIDPCETVNCFAGQTCMKGKCYDDDCLVDGVEKDCGEGHVCSKGQCVQSGCSEMTCDEGWECVTLSCEGDTCTGQCVETACIDYFCEEGRTCKGGKCVDNECLDMTCGEDMICSKGNCTYEICLDKDPCTTGKACNAEGACVFIEAPAIKLSEPEDKETDEAGKAISLELSLNNMPTSDVRIACEVITESPNKEVDAACDGVVFNADNWQLGQTIVVTGVDDYLKDGDQTYSLKVKTVSEDADFNDLEATSVELTNIDKTTPGFIVSETALTTYEDQSQDAATFTVVLSSIPAYEVALAVMSSRPDEGTVSPAILKFDKDNWNEPHVVTVKGVDDSTADGNVNYKINFAGSESEDPSYQDI
ncbi:MAG: hypothetical protein IKY83_00035, partial [Proteobacteria bacterium]|nr:hypothetical protein [Pseudomonadota bacterium]